MLPGLWTGNGASTAADYSSAVVPLEEAHLHSHSYRLRKRSEPERRLDGDVSDDEDDVAKDGDEEDTRMLAMGRNPEYSIEGLREEVRQGGRGKAWTDYERECRRLSFSLRPGWSGC